MSVSLVVLRQIAVMALLIAAGWLLARVGVITAAGNAQLSTLLTGCVIPVVIFSAFLSLPADAGGLRLLGQTAALCAASYAFSLLVAVLLYRRPGAGTAVDRACAVFTNNGFFGLPLLQALFGQQGVFYASISVLCNNLAMWTWGALQFTTRCAPAQQAAPAKGADAAPQKLTAPAPGMDATTRPAPAPQALAAKALTAPAQRGDAAPQKLAAPAKGAAGAGAAPQGAALSRQHAPQKGLWALLVRQPAALAAALGLAAYLLRLALSALGASGAAAGDGANAATILGPLLSALEAVKAMNTPLAMLVLGANLYATGWRWDVGLLRALRPAALRQLLLPLAFLLLTCRLPLPADLIFAVYVEAACPIAMLVSVLAMRYGAPPDQQRRATVTVIVSSLTALGTVPLMVALGSLLLPV